jgi:hypothetical protein
MNFDPEKLDISNLNIFVYMKAREDLSGSVLKYLEKVNQKIRPEDIPYVKVEVAGDFTKSNISTMVNEIVLMLKYLNSMVPQTDEFRMFSALTLDLNLFLAQNTVGIKTIRFYDFDFEGNTYIETTSFK